MQREVVSSALDRQLIIAAVTSTEFLRDAARIYDPKFMDSGITRVLLTWCIEYYKEYNGAPGRHIEEIFDTEEEFLDEGTSKVLKATLSSVSLQNEESPVLNVPFLIDELEALMRKGNLRCLQEELKRNLEGGNITEAELAVADFRRIEKPKAEWIDPFGDSEEIFSAFHEYQDPLFEFQGALGEMLNSHLVRGGFVAFLGPQKRGKSFWLQEVALRAYRFKRNVAYIQIGDMPKEEVVKRLGARISGRPLLQKDEGVIREPVLDCYRNQCNTCNKECRTCRVGIRNEKGELCPYEEQPSLYQPCTACKDMIQPTHWFHEVDIGKQLTWNDAYRIGQRVNKVAYPAQMRLSCVAEVSMDDIENLLAVWEDDGFYPDVIVIDYADNIVGKKGLEFRHTQNDIWKRLRAIALQRKCLVVTATQSDDAGSKAFILSDSNFSEDRRKLSHVTLLLGLNRTDREKEDGLMRINEIIAREGDYLVRRTVTVLQSLKRGRPCIDSYWTPLK